MQLRSSTGLIVVSVFAAVGCGRFGFDNECAQPGLLADDFDGPELAAPWIPWAEGNSAVALGGGALTVTPEADAASYAGVVSEHYYDLRGQRAFVEVAQVTGPGPTAQTFLQLISTSDQRLEVVAEDGQLRFRTYLDQQQQTVGSVSYDPVEYRYWQIRESDGLVYFETSADGRSFAERARIPAPFDVSLVRQQLGAGSWQAEAEPGVAIFEGFNGGEPAGRWCSISGLRDDFDDGERAGIWARSFSPDGCAEETGGELVLTAPAVFEDYCGYGSARPFDLRGSAVAIELVSGTPAASPAHAIFELRDESSGLRQQFIQEGDQLILRVPTVADLAIVPYDPQAHRHWRFADHSGDIVWQASADGASWTTIYVGPPAVDPAAVNVLIGVTQFADGTAPPPARWDNLGWR